MLSFYKQRALGDFVTIGQWEFNNDPVYAEYSDIDPLTGVQQLTGWGLNHNWRDLADALTEIHTGLAFTEQVSEPSGAGQPLQTLQGLWLKTGDRLHFKSNTDDETVAFLSDIYSLDPQESVKDQRDFTVNEPAVPANGDRYINTVTGVGSVTGQAVIATYIYQWNASNGNWTEIIPDIGTSLMDEALGSMWYFNGAAWVDLGTIVSHNDTAGKQGGQAGQYYHLTQAEHTELNAWLPNVTLGADGSISLKDDIALNFGATNDVTMKWLNAANTLKMTIYNRFDIYGNDTKLQIVNDTASDTDGDRKTFFSSMGKRSSGNYVDQGYITFVHEGALNDSKSRMMIMVNNGVGDGTVNEALRIDSNLDLTLAEEMLIHNDKYITLGDDARASRMGYISGVGLEHSVIDVPDGSAFWIGDVPGWLSYIGVFNWAGARGIDMAGSEDGISWSNLQITQIAGIVCNATYSDTDFVVYGIGAGNLAGKFDAGVDEWTFNKFINLTGEGIAYDDITISAWALGVTVSVPDAVQVTGTNIYGRGFDGNATAEQLFSSPEVLHDYKEDSDIELHLHWSPTTVNAGNVKWQIEYIWKNVDGTFQNSATVSVTVAAGGTAWKHLRSSLGAIAGANMDIGSVVIMRIFRDPADAADTYPDDAVLWDVGIHYQKDSLGSRTATTK